MRRFQFRRLLAWFRSWLSPQSLQNEADDKVETHVDDTAETSTDASPTEATPPAPSGGDNETEDGMWDEHWRSHFDSKPFGRRVKSIETRYETLS